MQGAAYAQKDQIYLAMTNEQILYKTRFAPTPSGLLHLGNIYSFAVTAALARKTGAKIFLRIDDIDRDRTNKAFVQDILDTLDFLGITYHEGPRTLQEYEHEYAQVHRTALYNNALNQLADRGLLFACDCSRTKIKHINADSIYQGICRYRALPLSRSDVNWRIITPEAADFRIATFVQGSVNAPFPELMKDFIVKRKDGNAAYQLTSVIDDLHFGVDLVVRGADLWHSTVAQHYLAASLSQPSFAKVVFHHHALLAGPDGSKLSKSAAADSVQYYRLQNKKPAYIFSLLSRLLHLNNDAQTWEEFISYIDLGAPISISAN